MVDKSELTCYIINERKALRGLSTGLCRFGNVFGEHLFYFDLFKFSSFWAGAVWDGEYWCSVWLLKFDAVFRNGDASEMMVALVTELCEHINEWFQGVSESSGYCNFAVPVYLELSGFVVMDA